MIEFLQEDTSFNLLEPTRIASWLDQVASKEGYHIERLTYVFCSDNYLLKINEQFLGKNYLTDIITFPYDHPDGIEADLLISIDRIEENAAERDLEFTDELQRVILHGLLHLMGYDDKDPDGRKQMRNAEDMYLKYLKQLMR